MDLDFSPYAVGGAQARSDSFTRLDPNFATGVYGLTQAAHSAGIPLQITSAYRSPELQAQLYASALERYGSPQAARRWVAPPGRSQHNYGTAVDFALNGSLIRDADSPAAQFIRNNAAQYGLSVPMSWEPWQVEPVGSRDGSRPQAAMTTSNATALSPGNATALSPGAALNFRGAPQMAMQPTQPQGLLGQLGIQRRDPTAQGETALPFYRRNGFSNTMGNLAMAFNSLRQNPDENIPRIITGQRATRKQDAANNRTVEWLNSQPGGERFAGLVESVGAAGALQAYQQSRAQPDQTSAMQNYQFLLAQGVPPSEAIERSFGDGGVTINTGDQIGDYLYGSDAGLPAGWRLDVATDTAEVIPGGPAAADLAAAETAAVARDAGEAGSGVIVLDDISKMISLIEESPRLTTGFLGNILSGVGGTQALDVSSLGETIRANIGFDRLQRMRDESPTGGALGQVAVQELVALQSTLGNINTAQSAPQVVRNLERLEDQYRRSMLRILNTEGGESFFSPAEVAQLRGAEPAGTVATHVYNPETGGVDPL